MSVESIDFRLKITRTGDSYFVQTDDGLEWQGSGPSVEALLGEIAARVQQVFEERGTEEYTPEQVLEAPGTEEYTPERVAESLLSSATNAVDYDSACAEVRRMGLDPEAIDHFRPAGT
jgi:hypothetical protein